MGNCFTSNKILAENDDPQGCSCNQPNQLIKDMGDVTVSKSERAADGVKTNNNNMEKKTNNNKKKVVRFNLNEKNSGDDRSGKQGESKNGVVRIRLVVTQEELKQILSSKKDLRQSSMEQLIKAVKLRGVRVSEDGRTSDGAWRPALESIPEEH
ncbi:hypothetical protein CXB51_005211 [Gossypium anomalum]|uniref:Uncharacterized protein n=1 Tax=Gossypium anomalum TaxID=47600 RepID=A0A8J5Z2B2_9ROSI|nr:hypothetical protein CXB51_005211 [Gossypium anomalum]